MRAARAGERREVLRFGEKIKRRRGRACSPPRQWVGDGLGAGEAAVAEIDADGRASVPARVARSGGGRRGPGARDPREGDTCGDGRRDELEEVVADDEECRMAGNGAATGLHGGGACGEVWGVYGVEKGRSRGSAMA
jgi:hypothetical protein